MPYLKTIVKYINTTLESTLLSNKCFANKSIIDLAQSMPRNQVQYNDGSSFLEIIPCYVDHDGNAVYVAEDFTADLIIYHRINNISTGKATLPAFGDNKAVDAHRNNMSMVVFGKRDHLRMSNDDLAIRLHANMPDAVTKEMLNEMKFSACNINTSEIILNDMQVFNEEYQNVKFFLKPEQFLFKVNYTIESAFLKKCFTNCD